MVSLPSHKEKEDSLNPLSMTDLVDNVGRSLGGVSLRPAVAVGDRLVGEAADVGHAVVHSLLQLKKNKSIVNKGSTTMNDDQ